MMIDKPRIARAIKEILFAIDEDPKREGLLDTPIRVANAYEELLTYPEFSFTSFANEQRYDEFIIVKDILFTSLCEHHLLPFTGKATVGYLPNNRIVGLSKLVRLVQSRAARLQLQERLTTEIANILEKELNPLGVGVVIEAEHFCMSVRGVKSPNHKTITSAMLGVLREKPEARQEFLELIK
jgi:GTP cyclohydrolase I